jgi:hypothetical protein
LRRRPEEAPVFVSRTLYKDNFGGTAMHCLGVCALRYELSRWNGRTLEPIGAVFTRYDSE